MKTRNARPRNKIARSVAMALVAASMLPLNGCGPLAPLMGILGKAVPALAPFMGILGQVGNFLPGNSSSSSNSSLQMPPMPFQNQTNGDANGQTSDAVQGVIGNSTVVPGVYGLGTANDNTNGSPQA